MRYYSLGPIIAEKFQFSVVVLIEINHKRVFKCFFLYRPERCAPQKVVNKLLDVMSSVDVGFLLNQIDTIGKAMTSAISGGLWY